MACNCKNTITSFLGGDVPNPTTFLNCGEADGTYNNPLSTGKTQCVAEDNVLRILDEYYVSGTVKNAGQIIFERTYTADTENWDEWNNSGDGFFKPILSGNWNLSASSLTTSSNVSASGATFQGNVVISGTNTTLNTLSANTAINVGNGNGTVSAATLTAGNVLKSNGTLVVTGNTVMNGTLSASSINVGNGNGTISANTFTAPSITIGQESGVITGTTVVAKYSGVTITNATDRTIAMTTATFRPGMVVEFDMGTGSGDITVELPALSGWYYGKYTFLFTALPNAGSNFIINGAGSEKFYGVTMCLDGNEIINGADTITFGAGKTTAGTKVEIISTRQDRMMMYITSNSNKADITPS